MATITGNQNFPTSAQVPTQAIMDIFGKQAYLGNQFIVCTTSVTISDTTEDNLLSLANPASATKSLFIQLRKFLGGDATNSLIFRTYSNPTTIASGTAKTPINCRTGSSTTSSATSKQAPTTATKGTLLSTCGVSTPALQFSDNTMIILDPGQSILITVQASGQPTAAIAELVWYEI